MIGLLTESSHTVVNVDGLMRPLPLPPVNAEVESMRSESPEPSMVANEKAIDISDEDEDENEPLIASAECRICQDECPIKNLESPCSCSGSLKYAHRKCVQRWCNEKGNIICEICHQPYQPGYTAPPPPLQPEETTIDIGGGWTISGLDLHDPRLLAIAEAERRYLESEYVEYTASSASGAAFCRSAALILMALLLLRHALTITDDADGEEDDPSSILSLVLLRAAGFLLPCYIMAWAISILQRRRQQQEAAALATQFALMLQSGQPRTVHFTVAPVSPSSSITSATTSTQQQHEEPV
uniref:Putative E3 ubiquitin ligase SUD1 n=1 Tax=Noccaea caerulescens TaxID=107243 RepID=A0A1J3INP6_NOCCA